MLAKIMLKLLGSSSQNMFDFIIYIFCIFIALFYGLLQSCYNVLILTAKFLRLSSWISENTSRR